MLPCASRDLGLRPGVAKRIAVAAWMLHGLRFGRKPGHETLFFRAGAGTLVESQCFALTTDGVHTAILFLNAHRAGSECRLSQADAAWVRNVIPDSEHFLPDLLHEMP